MTARLPAPVDPLTVRTVVDVSAVPAVRAVRAVLVLFAVLIAGATATFAVRDFVVPADVFWLADVAALTRACGLSEAVLSPLAAGEAVLPGASVLLRVELLLAVAVVAISLADRFCVVVLLLAVALVLALPVADAEDSGLGEGSVPGSGDRDRLKLGEAVPDG